MRSTWLILPLLTLLLSSCTHFTGPAGEQRREALKARKVELRNTAAAAKEKARQEAAAFKARKDEEKRAARAAEEANQVRKLEALLAEQPQSSGPAKLETPSDTPQDGVESSRPWFLKKVSSTAEDLAVRETSADFKQHGRLAAVREVSSGRTRGGFLGRLMSRGSSAPSKLPNPELSSNPATRDESYQLAESSAPSEGLDSVENDLDDEWGSSHLFPDEPANQSDPVVSLSPETEQSTAVITHPSLVGYLGLTKWEAIAKARKAGQSWRIAVQDGNRFPGTAKPDPNQINLILEKDIVTGATKG